MNPALQNMAGWLDRSVDPHLLANHPRNSIDKMARMSPLKGAWMNAFGATSLKKKAYRYQNGVNIVHSTWGTTYLKKYTCIHKCEAVA